MLTTLTFRWDEVNILKLQVAFILWSCCYVQNYRFILVLRLFYSVFSQNHRPDYISIFIEKLVSWEAVSSRLKIAKARAAEREGEEERKRREEQEKTADGEAVEMYLDNDTDNSEVEWIRFSFAVRVIRQRSFGCQSYFSLNHDTEVSNSRYTR